MSFDSYFANINEGYLIDVTHPVSFLHSWSLHSCRLAIAVIPQTYQPILDYGYLFNYCKIWECIVNQDDGIGSNRIMATCAFLIRLPPATTCLPTSDFIKYRLLWLIHLFILSRLLSSCNGPAHKNAFRTNEATIRIDPRRPTVSATTP